MFSNFPSFYFLIHRCRDISNKPLQECTHASDSMANKPNNSKKKLRRMTESKKVNHDCSIL